MLFCMMTSERLVFHISFFLFKVSLLIKGWILCCEIIQKELVFLLHLQILNFWMRHAALILNVFLPMEIFLLLASFLLWRLLRKRWVFQQCSKLFSQLSSSWWKSWDTSHLAVPLPLENSTFYIQTVSPSLLISGL